MMENAASMGSSTEDILGHPFQYFTIDSTEWAHVGHGAPNESMESLTSIERIRSRKMICPEAHFDALAAAMQETPSVDIVDIVVQNFRKLLASDTASFP